MLGPNFAKNIRNPLIIAVAALGVTALQGKNVQAPSKGNAITSTLNLPPTENKIKLSMIGEVEKDPNLAAKLYDSSYDSGRVDSLPDGVSLKDAVYIDVALIEAAKVSVPVVIKYTGEPTIFEATATLPRKH